MHSIFTSTARVVIGCAVLLLTPSIQAAGFYISEVGTPGSLGTAGVANPVLGEFLFMQQSVTERDHCSVMPMNSF